jgi:hypothetical protein
MQFAVSEFDALKDARSKGIKCKQFAVQTCEVMGEFW